MSRLQRPGQRPPADLRFDDDAVADLPLEPGPAPPSPVATRADRPVVPRRPDLAGTRRRTWLVAVLAALAGAAAGWFLKPDPALGVPSAAILDFGAVRQATTSDALSLGLTNAGERALAVTRVAVAGEAGGEFTLTDDGCSGRRLAQGKRCTVEVVFTPAATGPRRAVLEVASAAPEGALAVPLIGLGVAPQLEAEPREIDFGDQLVGTASGRSTLRVANRGSAPLTVRTVQLAGTGAGDFAVSDGCSGRTLAPGERCSLAFAFLPTAAGERPAEVRIASDAGAAVAAMPRLTGRGLPRRAALGLAPGRLEFEPQLTGTASEPRKVTLTNAGTAPLTLRELRVATGAGAAGFEVRAGGCAGRRLPPGASCSAEVVFRPDREGPAAALLEIAHDGDEGRARLPLAGTGTTPEIFLDPRVMDFGPVRVGQASEPRFLSVVNSGSGPLVITEIRVRGAGAQAFSARPVGCTTAPVKPKSSCGVEVRFQPHRGGAFDAELFLRHNDARGPDRVVLRGLGRLP